MKSSKTLVLMSYSTMTVVLAIVRWRRWQEIGGHRTTHIICYGRHLNVTQYNSQCLHFMNMHVNSNRIVSVK